MRVSPRSRVVTALAVAAILTAPAHASADAPNFERLLADRPFAGLWTQVSACHHIETLNSLTGEDLDRRLDRLTAWFRHVNAQNSNRFMLGRDCIGSSSTTLASKLAARGLVVSTYRNGSSTSQSSRSASLNFFEAANLERVAPLAIGTFWPGDWRPNRGGNLSSPASRLTRELSRTATSVRLHAVGTGRPTDAPRAWPFFASRGAGLNAGAYSQNTHDVVSWLRVGNEIMQIVEPSNVRDGVVRLEVRRAIWGTSPRRHEAGSRALAPVYVGSAPQDAHLAGTPEQDDRDIPLRYALKVWSDAAHRWLIARIGATFGSGWQGHNAIWLDTTSCVQYSNADALGNQVFGWDERIDAKLTPERWGAGQRSKIRAIREAFPLKGVFANNLGNTSGCTRKLLAEVDGAGFEHWLSWGGGRTLDWDGSIQHLIDVQADDAPATLWVRWDYGFSGSSSRYRRFAYGSYLVARDAAATRTTFGGPWDLGRPEDLFFWNWGEPREPVATIDELLIDGTPLSARRYRHGLVIVNPTATSVTHPLGATYYDVVDRTRAGIPRAVTSVTVKARDAVFLLRSR